MSQTCINNTYFCSLVIPTKNGGELFKEVVRGLQRQNCWSAVQFIVIDSGSTDSTVEVAKNAGAYVKQIPPEQFNHGATRDLGIDLAISDYVILLVQDAIPKDEKLIENLVNCLSADGGVGGVYARQIPQASADVITKKNLNEWLTGRLDKEVRSIENIPSYVSLSPIEKYFFCNFDNVCSGLNKNVWQKERFGNINFGEDIDWAERVLTIGYKIVYEPSAAVIHSHDRPLSYEYKRTYVCHRKLYQQFGLHLVPSRKGIFRSWIYATVSGAKFVISNERRKTAALALLCKLPILNFLSALAQYNAVQDEKKSIVKKISGV